MGKKVVAVKGQEATNARNDEFGALIGEVRELVRSARHAAASTVNSLQVMTNFEIGRRIVEHEQQGAERAAYGSRLLKELSARLTDEFGRGFSEDNLSRMRKFYVTWSERVTEIPQSLRGNYLAGDDQADAGDRRSLPPATTTNSNRASPFTLSWSHYVLLMAIRDPEERDFYEIEATAEGWSVPELKRQVASSLYERLALSRNKEAVKQLAREGQIVLRPEDILKEPYVLEFLGLDEKAAYSESDGMGARSEAVVSRVRALSPSCF